MTGILAAWAWAVAAYLRVTAGALPTRAAPPGAAARRRAPAPGAGWSVTARSVKLLGWDPGRLRVLAGVTAALVGLGWALVVQNLPAGLFMGIIGWQLPGFAAEVAAGRQLDLLQRQVSVFVGTVNDSLHTQGATAEDALLAAARGVRGGPLAPIAAAYLRRTEAGVPFADRLRLLGQEVDLPSFRFFVDLMQVRERTGVEHMARAFDTLDEQFREDERTQATVRGELSLYLGILVVSLAVDLAVFPAYRAFSPNWPLIRAHLGFLISLAALVGAVVFSGVRRFARARVTAG
ncbi:MAG: type II secretion system F family protein [Actinomycetia bacterium]|nr:type II secretion system F family protein [Actinomycetes bacterium]